MDLIDRGALVDALMGAGMAVMEPDTLIAVREVAQIVHDAPTVEPKRGRWLIVAQSAYVCSECMSIRSHAENYCAMCGAKMEGR